MQRVLAQTRAVLLEALFDLLGDPALDIDGGAVIEIARLRALEPDELAGVALLLGHGGFPWGVLAATRESRRARWSRTRRRMLCIGSARRGQAMISVTTPEPTVRPPSRM